VYNGMLQMQALLGTQPAHKHMTMSIFRWQLLQVPEPFPDAFGLSKRHLRLKKNAEEKCDVLPLHLVTDHA
jgi:hypothetical protein